MKMKSESQAWTENKDIKSSMKRESKRNKERNMARAIRWAGDGTCNPHYYPCNATVLSLLSYYHLKVRL